MRPPARRSSRRKRVGSLIDNRSPRCLRPPETPSEGFLLSAGLKTQLVSAHAVTHNAAHEPMRSETADRCGACETLPREAFHERHAIRRVDLFAAAPTIAAGAAVNS